MGHPDKLADQISDGVLDALLAQDPMSRVACETMVTTGLCVIAGEITTKAYVDMQKVVREVIHDVGYTEADDGHQRRPLLRARRSPRAERPTSRWASNDDAAEGQGRRRRRPGPDVRLRLQRHRRVDAAADLAGPPDHQSPDRSPLQKGEVNWLRPDSKSQVTVEFDGAHARPHRHGRRLDAARAGRDARRDPASSSSNKIIKPVLPADLVSDDIKYHINPTGQFVIGGPHGDCGLTGRKIIVDTYGGWGRHGGGAFSGKDPTKVDRSAAYMARYVAKNIVAAGLADRCEVQLAYAIGVSEPVSVSVDTEGTGQIDDARICELVREIFPLTPSGIIKHLDLRRPIYRKTAAGGHFGRNEPEFTWEKTDKAKALAAAAEVNRRRAAR